MCIWSRPASFSLQAVYYSRHIYFAYTIEKRHAFVTPHVSRNGPPYKMANEFRCCREPFGNQRICTTGVEMFIFLGRVEISEFIPRFRVEDKLFEKRVLGSSTGFREPKTGFASTLNTAFWFSQVFMSTVVPQYKCICFYEIRDRCRSIARRVGHLLPPHEHRRRHVRTSG